MRKNSRVKIMAFAVSALLCAAVSHAADTGNPSEVNLKVYEFWVFSDAACTQNGTRIYNETNPTAQDVISNPTFGSGNAANGNYPCVAMKLSDQISAKPAFTSDTGNCVQGATIAGDILSDAQSTSTDPNGNTITGASGEQTPYAYFSTSGNSDDGCFSPSTRCLMDSAFVVTTDSVATLVVNFNNKVQDDSGECFLNAPVFSFR